MIWLQIMVAAPKVTTAAGASQPACACCVAKTTCGCVETATPEALPVTAATLPVNSSTDFHADLMRAAIPVVGVMTAANFSSSPAFFELVPAVPLFQRNCALLI